MGLTQFFKRKPKAGSHSVFGVTPLGKTKAEEYSLSGPKWEVLSVLNENGPSSVSEIANEVKASPEKVKAILRALMNTGYVRKVSSEE